MGNLLRKLILTFNYYGLSKAAKLKKEADMATSHQTNIAIVPGLTPTPGTVINMIAAQRNLIAKRASLNLQVKQITKQILQGEKDLNDVFIDKWRTQVQTAIEGDESKGILLSWGIKGQDTGHTPQSVLIAKEVDQPSCPFIGRINLNVHTKHILYIYNNNTVKHKLPAGILRIDIYGQTGGDAPTDYTLMGRSLGQSTKGKFICEFALEDVGKMQYYIAVYISKKTKRPVAQSPVVSGMIN